MKKRIFDYLNPISRLGKTRYSYKLPLLTTLGVGILLDLYTKYILKNPEAVGLYAIFLFLALIIYFSFRDGIRGGFITTTITVGYYIYIIFSQNYSGDRLVTGLETTGILGLLYYFIASIIGWLKQTIDRLIEREVDEKRWLQAILQQLPVGVIITDKEGKITQVNRQVETIFGIKIPLGYRVGQEPTLKSYEKGKPFNPSQSPLLLALKRGRAIVGREYEIERNDGKKVYLQVNVAPIQSSSGKVLGAAQISNDITLQKELDQRKDDFVNMASHELKTPLTSMILYMDALKIHLKELHDDKSLKTLTNIKNQTDRLLELVNNLLDVSRLQTGKLVFQKEKFHVDELISEIVEELQVTTKQKLVFNNTRSTILTADKFRVYQVVTNLITNAIKYSPEDKEIIIKVRKNQGKVVISVQDFGIGINKDQQKKIFDKLYQVTDVNKRYISGFGMGLYITKEIVRRHKGQIWVESEKGKGSTFFVSLPSEQEKIK